MSGRNEYIAALNKFNKDFNMNFSIDDQQKTAQKMQYLDQFLFETKIQHFVPTKIIENQGHFFLLLKRMQRRCIGEQKKKKIRVESGGREKKSPHC